MTADSLQLWLALATLPFTCHFIYMFAKPSEKFWRTWFGVSLMLIAIAVLCGELSIIFYRLFGGDYPGRDIIRVTAQALTLAAMSMRDRVLFLAQRGDKTPRPHL